MLHAMKRQRALRANPRVDESLARDFAAASRRQIIKSEWLLDGSLLTRLAGDHGNKFAQLVPQRPIAPSGVRTWASMCSGSEGCHFVFEAMECAYRTCGYATEFKHAFACEIDEQKRKWIHSVINSGKQPQDMICTSAICKTTLQLAGRTAAVAQYPQWISSSLGPLARI